MQFFKFSEFENLPPDSGGGVNSKFTNPQKRNFEYSKFTYGYGTRL